MTQQYAEAKELTEDEWLAHRQSGIGASEVTTALGLSPWKSAYTLWAEKSGLKAPDPVEGIAVELGHFLEPFLAKKYAQATGRYVTDPGDFTIFQHPDYPYMFCTPDKIIEFSQSEQGPLETKSTGEYAGKLWAEGDAPMAAQAQIQMQMLIMGHTRGSLAGLVGNRAFHWFDVERNDALCEKMVAGLVEFWDRVQTKTPPPIDGSVSTKETLQALHPNDNGETVELPNNAVVLQEQMEMYSGQIKDIEKRVDTIKNEFRAAIGDATFGEYGDIRYSLKTTERKDTISVTLDTEEELKAAGIPYKRKKGSVYRTLRKLKAIAND